MNNLRKIILLIITICFVITQCYGQNFSDSRYSLITTSISINGLVSKPLTLSVDSLKQLKTIKINNFNLIGKDNKIKRRINSFEGVLLKDILNKARITSNNKEATKLYIKLTASDNYTIVFSWSEIFNHPSGEKVFVIFEENEKPLEENGAFALITMDDNINGLRHLKWLKEISVKTAE
ncbi:molybdopterin-dependent oxidoreductase [Pedobacter glucosidilyticus]|uniref:molybdopterin-dependent oxidoreductase n=1 Tax=Pedobacter glucosidilyticus TaxID=1122941 RepID=UPI0006865A43|nr:molybdopterin-dependent oxidoreductase [Pedobacter glucosidilyticus]